MTSIILEFEMTAFPGGSYYNDETHFSFAIILDTVKGKGVTEVEEAAGNHSMNVKPEVFDGWIAEIKSKLAALEA